MSSIYTVFFIFFFFFKQKTAYEMRISDWSSDVCSSDLDLQASDHTAAELLTSTRDNAEQQARIYRIIGLMDQWREEIANVEINEIQEGQNGEASTLIATGRGKQPPDVIQARSEEHTSELQSLMRISYAVFCL